MDSRTEKGSAAFSEVLSHLPTFLITLQSSTAKLPLTKRLFGAVMFADISGFTALCESYTKPDEKGVCSTDQLTKCLNDYLGRIIDSILSGGGDVFKFAGDAFLALWPCHKAQLTQVVPAVLQTSLDIQEKCNDYKTDKGVQLRLKIGLAAGAMDVFVIGGSEAKQYALTGQAIADVNLAQNLASAGGVTVSPAAQDACSDYSYRGRVVKHGYMQVTKMSPSTVQSSDKESLLSTFRNLSSLSLPHQSLYYSNSNQLLSTMQENQEADDVTSLTLEEQESLKTYLPKAVVSKFNDGQSFDWLSEMRIVSVLFINVPGVDTKRDPDVALEQLQLIFTVIHKNVTRLDGSVNKFFMFDKGSTFLAIFGLPGQKHENDPARALRAARQIFLHLEERGMSCNIGVTTGMAFCGVVGHTNRHEFTVIGSSVNMAARLMMAFPGSVTCDGLSMKHSGINSKLFKRVVPDKPLKGIEDAGSLYSYSTEIHHDHFFSSMDKTVVYNEEAAQQAINTLVGRRQELEYFEIELSKLTKYHEEEWRDPTCVVIEGFPGTGKTKLLKIFKGKAYEKQFRVVSGHASQVEQHTPFYAVKTLVALLLGLGQCHSCQEREKVIISKVSETLKPDLPLLNELLNIHLPHSPRTQHLTSEEHTEKLHSLLFSIVHHVVLAKPCVFFVDDAQWVDVESWTFLYDLASDGSALLVLGMRPFSRSIKVPAEAEQILYHPHTVHMKLSPLDDSEMVQLACVVLDVCRLPRELEQLTARCNGVPLFCKELVSSMLRHGQLNIIPVENFDSEPGRRMSMRPMRYRKSSRVPSFLDANNTTTLISTNVCVIAPGVDLNSVTVPTTVKELVLTRIDRQSHRNRLLMKCASVLGVVFTRNMLAGIIPDKMFNELPDAINELVRSTIFECAVAAAARKVTDPGALPDVDDELYCHCMATDKQEDYVVCNTLRFTETYLQETSYGLMLTDQKKYLHRRAAELMESQAHKCRYCGGGDFMKGSVEHHHAFQVQRVFVRQWGSMGLEGGPRQRAFIGQVGTKRVQKRRAFSISSSASVSSSVPASRRSSDVDSLGSDGPPLGSDGPPLADTLKQFQQQLSKTASGSRLSSLTENNLFSEIEDDFCGVDLTHCECAEVLSHVYPQLVRHYEAAGVRQKSVLYMVEAGAAAVQTSANLEAVAHLQRAKKIIEDSRQWHQGLIHVSKEETARIESLLGQALFQMGHSEESMPHFYEALRILGKRQPRESQFAMVWRTVVEGVKQAMHLKFPNRFRRKASDGKSQCLFEQAECLAHIAHAHHLHHNNLGTVMAALQQLNAVETAQEDVRQLLEAYCVMIECCQHFGLRSLARKYEKMALSLGDSVQTTPDDLIAVAHFQSVALNMHLADGDMRLAIQSGKSAMLMAAALHDIKVPLTVLPLYFHVVLAESMDDEIDSTLVRLRNLWMEDNERVAGAWYFACCLELYLTTGSLYETIEACVGFADDFCHDVLAIDAVPDAAFYLASLIALWNCREGNWNNVSYWLDLSFDLRPETYEAFICTQALYNLTKSRLMYAISKQTDLRVMLPVIQERLKVLKKVCKQLPVFKSKCWELKHEFRKAKLMCSQQNRLPGSRRRSWNYLCKLCSRLKRRGRVRPDENCSRK